MTMQSLTPLARLMPKDTHSTAVHREVTKLLSQVMEWNNRPNDKYKDESCMWYGMDKFGMVSKDYKSNFLEVLRLVDRKTDEVSRNECLFVVLEPRVFKLFNRIILFFGTVGDRMEQDGLARRMRPSFSLAVTPKLALPWAVDSSPCEYLSRRSFHTDVYDSVNDSSVCHVDSGSSACAELYGDEICRKTCLAATSALLSVPRHNNQSEGDVRDEVYLGSSDARRDGVSASASGHWPVPCIHNQNKCHNRVEEEWTRRVPVEVVLWPLHLVIGALLCV